MPKDKEVSLEELVRVRVLPLTVDTETGEITPDVTGFSPWEVHGIAAWFGEFAENLLGESFGESA